MYKRTILAVVFFCCVLMAFVCYAQKDINSDNGEYVISPDDVLDISVYGESDLTTVAKVSRDGSINYPLLGNIQAGGLTIRQLESSITDLLQRDYLVNPQVKVSIKEYSQISILGEVRNPGSYQLKENLTLTQAIALAGDFKDSADTAKVKIIRSKPGAGESSIYEVDFDDILNKKIKDPEIKANDKIIVEPMGRISIIGQVIRPGTYELKKGLTVVEAIGLAGGFTPIAAQNATRVVRTEDGRKVIINIPVANITRGSDTDKNIQLEPGDTILVPESFF